MARNWTGRSRAGGARLEVVIPAVLHRFHNKRFAEMPDHVLPTVAGFLTVDGGQPFTVGVYHATPFGRGMRGDQAERLAAAVAGRGQRVAIGGDWSNISAARKANGAFYDEDPYAGHAFRPSWIHQCVWTYKPDGTRVHEADRNASDILLAGGLYDAAAAGRRWRATVGHHESDGIGVSRRIDGFYVDGSCCRRCAAARCSTPRRPRD